ncbi:MAG: LLM class flavin-dependent oxidoreductase [Thaumarchaeota archaeon]|nr:LLM class flavin-dependent oxidoreductase [Nitrososphaerota archaeon]
MRFGIKTGQSQSAYTYEELSSVWSKSEELGFDSAWLHDHLLAVSFTDSTSDPCLEAYTTLAALARDTKRLRLGVMVTCVSYRNPAYLAKVGATIDSISRGRFIMGIGAGWNEAEYNAYGYKFPSVPDRLGQLREALKILRLMWTETSPSFAGRHFSILGASCNPKPVQRNLPIWVGISTGTRTLPRMSVELADGLNATANPALCGQIIESAEVTRKDMKRERSGVTYSAQPTLLVGTESEIENIVEKEASRVGMLSRHYLSKLRDKRCIIGTPERCAQELRAYADAGVDYLIPMIIGDRLLWPLENIRDRLLPLL